MPDPVILIVASAMIFAPACSWLAFQRGRSRAAWFAFGIALGPVAAALLLIAPPGRCPSCGTRTVGWPSRCEGCGLVFASGATEHAAGQPDVGPREYLRALPDPPSREIGIPLTPTLESDARRFPRSGSSADPHAATSLGYRPAFQAPIAGPREQPNASVAILGSAIFVGGSEGLEVGSRYFIARVGKEMQVLGPIHISPEAVAARIPLANLATTVVADRLLVTAQDGGNPNLAFSGLASQSGVDLQQQLLAPPGRAAAR